MRSANCESQRPPESPTPGQAANVRILYTASIPPEKAPGHTEAPARRFHGTLVRRPFRAYRREHGMYTQGIPTAFQEVGECMSVVGGGSSLSRGSGWRGSRERRD